VIVSKYRIKMLYGRVKKHRGKILRELCRYKDIELLEGHAMPDHIIGSAEIQYSDDNRVSEGEKRDTDTWGATEGNERVYE
jgi:REP element-mobilizing transposase RayT